MFLTHTKALALQQAEVISKVTSLEVGVYTGDMNVDAWDREKWTGEIEKSQVWPFLTILDAMNSKKSALKM